MGIKVNANPIMIKWAREDAGFSLDELPDYLKNAEKWETGEEKPTWADLRKLAKKYKRPSFFYFLPEPPKQDKDLVEFRSDEKIEEFSPALRLEIRKAKFRRNAFIHVNEDMGVKVPDFSSHVLFSNDEFELAKHIRNYLNVDYETQKKWLVNDNGNKSYNHSNFLKHWKEIFFRLGILVFEIENVSEQELSGCSIYYDSCPIILLNGKNTPNRRIFTLMHELTHLTKGVSAICDVDKHNKKETFCNKVAAEILIPKEDINRDELFYKNGNLNLSGAAHMHGVSKQTVVYKLNSLKIISDDLKNEYIGQIEEKNRLDKERVIERYANSSPQMSTKIRKNKYEGEPYTRLILQAYENKVITAPKAVKYLDTTIDKITDLINEL